MNMHISHYGFLHNKKKKYSKKNYKKNISGIRELFANTSHLTKIIPIPICKFWNQ